MATDAEIKAGAYALLDHMYPKALAVDLPVIEDARIVARLVIEAAEAVRDCEQSGKQT